MVDLPTHHITRLSRQYPEIWRTVEGIRFDSKKTPNWPEWCFCPVTVWRDILISYPQANPEDLSLLAAVGAWRYTQGIYRFDPDMLDALFKTKLEGMLPSNVLFRMPAWSVYLDLPGWVISPFSPISGAFCFLEFNPNRARAELRIVLDFSDSLFPTPPLWLGDWPITEAMTKSVDNSMNLLRKEKPGATILEYANSEGLNSSIAKMAQAVTPIVSVLLYLCSEAPDIEGHLPGVHISRPMPKKTKKGMRLFPPDKPRVWNVGQTMGGLIRQAEAGMRIQGERSGPRPHIRSQHWHGYWKGPKDPKPDGPAREFFYRWLPSFPVGYGDEG